MNGTETNLSQPILQNNMAVSSMIRLDFNAAIRILSNALRVCRTDMMENGATFAAESGSSEGDVIPADLDQCMTMNNSSCFEDNTNNEDDDLTKRFIYSKPIRIPAYVSTEDVFTSANYHKLSVLVATIVTFNLALAYHISSAQQGFKTLQKAAQLYEVAFKLQRQTCLGSNAVFTLAITNNMGVIRRQMHNAPYLPF